jgi:opacity protein-like surface antigen
MKIFSCSFWVIFSICIFAQRVEPISPFSTFQLGVLGGINFSSLVGTSIVIEGSTNLTSQVNLKLSLGYSTINKEEGYKVKTYYYINYIDIYQQEVNIYQTLSYTVDEINYTVVPITLGLEYVFTNDRNSPFALIEIGYNFYSFKTTKSYLKYTGGGYYDTYDELPSEFKNEAPDIPKDDSYTIALGLGMKYKLSSRFNLYLRYAYQFNYSLVNTNQILIGFNF